MNVKTIDDWSIYHFIIPLTFGYFLLEVFGLPLFIVYGLVIFFELLEHTVTGDALFRWKESGKREFYTNSTLDVILGILGVFIASTMQIFF